MTQRPSHLAMLWLVAASVLVQSLWAGVPGGLSLCIGCDEGGWSLAQADEAASASTCCSTEAAQAEREPQALAALCESDPCDCIRIPMRSVPDLTLQAPRADSTTAPSVLLAPVIAFVAPSDMPESARHARPPRAGPSTPRLLTPMSRCTVLLL